MLNLQSENAATVRLLAEDSKKRNCVLGLSPQFEKKPDNDIMTKETKRKRQRDKFNKGEMQQTETVSDRSKSREVYRNSSPLIVDENTPNEAANGNSRKKLKGADSNRENVDLQFSATDQVLPLNKVHKEIDNTNSKGEEGGGKVSAMKSESYLSSSGPPRIISECSSCASPIMPEVPEEGAATERASDNLESKSDSLDTAENKLGRSSPSECDNATAGGGVVIKRETESEAITNDFHFTRQPDPVIRTETTSATSMMMNDGDDNPASKESFLKELMMADSDDSTEMSDDDPSQDSNDETFFATADADANDTKSRYSVPVKGEDDDRYDEMKWKTESQNDAIPNPEETFDDDDDHHHATAGNCVAFAERNEGHIDGATKGVVNPEQEEHLCKTEDDYYHYDDVPVKNEGVTERSEGHAFPPPPPPRSPMGQKKKSNPEVVDLISSPEQEQQNQEQEESEDDTIMYTSFDAFDEGLGDSL